jgi:hypothetical protein
VGVYAVPSCGEQSEPRRRGSALACRIRSIGQTRVFHSHLRSSP